MWTRVSDVEAARTWDRDLAVFPDRSMTQTFRWGAYKAHGGWTPLRLVAHDAHGRLQAMLQVLARRYPARTSVTWCPGGLAGPIEFWNAGLLECMSASLGAWQLYCRVAFNRAKNLDDVEYLRMQGWRSPSRHLSASRTMIWSLGSSDDEMMAGLSGNWRHNVRRAQQRHPHVERWTNPSPAALGATYAAMSSQKGMAPEFNAAELSAMLQSLDGQIVMYGCADDAGTPLAFRACLIQGDRAWDLLAATAPEGRRSYASYAVLWKLVRHCSSAGVKAYDLSGVDPIKAPGVYDFKRGTGALEQESLGEWEWATSALLRRAVGIRMRVS